MYGLIRTVTDCLHSSENDQMNCKHLPLLGLDYCMLVHTGSLGVLQCC